MKKKYNCRLSASSLLVNVKGKVIRCEFEPDVVNAYGMRGCSYKTENKDIQHAIEHHPRFRTVNIDRIWTDDVEPKAETPVIEVEPVAAEAHAVEKKPRRIKTKKEE